MIPVFPSTFSDATQVQCVKPYKARENDELALEKADIIMILQLSSDGELVRWGTRRDRTLFALRKYQVI